MSILSPKVGKIGVFRPSNLLWGTHEHPYIGDRLAISGHAASCGKVLRKLAQGRRKIGGGKKLQEAQLSLRDRATRACQLKSGKVLHKCRRLVFEKL